MKSDLLKLTIVIPVYNEQRYLRQCLEAIATQSVQPDEVIVVDNNSTDASAGIAKSYGFVTLLHEPRQSQVFAQKTGFDAASSSIIGRIDADSILPPDWVAKVGTYFQNHPDVVGITGSALPYDVYLPGLFKRGFDAYYRLSSWWAGHRLLWGANMAIRADAWQKISDEVLQQPDIWEDYDVSFCLARHGKLRRLDGINVKSSFRAIKKPPLNQISYQFRSVRTFRLRKGNIIATLFGITWLSTVITYPVVLFDSHIIGWFRGRK